MSLLAGTPFADVRIVEETASTNADAAALLGTGRGTTIVAEVQTAGVGRTGRMWHAPQYTSLLFTSVLPISLAARDLWAATFWTALVVAEGIADACGVRAELKWPNDLMLNGRKLCGILCISRVNGERAFVGCGVGINVHRPLDTGALSAIQPAPAFLSDVAAHVDRTTLLIAILAAFARRLPLLELPDVVARAWETRAAIAGQRYRLRLDRDGSIVEGIVRGLGPGGAIRIAPEGASEVDVHLADAHVLR